MIFINKNSHPRRIGHRKFFSFASSGRYYDVRYDPSCNPMQLCCLLKKNLFHMPHDIPHFRRGHKILYEQVSKNNKKQEPMNTISTS